MLQRMRKRSREEDVAMAMNGSRFLDRESMWVDAVTGSKLVGGGQEEIVARLEGLEIEGEGIDRCVRFGKEPEVVGKSAGACGRSDVMMG